MFLHQLPHSALNPALFWKWAESAVLEEVEKLESLCRCVEETLNAPVVQVGTDSPESGIFHNTVQSVFVFLLVPVKNVPVPQSRLFSLFLLSCFGAT